MERTLPPLVQHVELLKKHSHCLFQTMDSTAEPSDLSEDAKIEQEFILGQLLLMTEYQDYQVDEMGRRNLLNLLRDFLLYLELPEEITLAVTKTLRIMAVSDDDFVRMMVELLHDLYEPHVDAEQDLADMNMDMSISLLKSLELLKCALLTVDKVFQSFIHIDLCRPSDNNGCFEHFHYSSHSYEQ